MNTRFALTTALVAALGLACPSLGAEELVANFSGNGSGNTAEFEVHAPWIMEWVVGGEAGQYEVIEIGMVDATTGAYQGVAVRSKTAGSGVRLFDTSGRFYFRVASSLMNWHIKVAELTADEASEYKPVE